MPTSLPAFSEPSPLGSVVPMTALIAPPGLEGRILDLLTPSLEALGFEIVRVQVQGDRRKTLQLMIDRVDGAQVGLEDCELASRQASAVLDVEDPVKAAYTLEVSSPGIDRPLTRPKDWLRYLGHQARAELLIPKDGRKRYDGTIVSATATTATLRLDGGVEIMVDFAELRRAKLVLTDALIEATAAKPPN